MPKKRFSAVHIITLLRQIEVVMAEINFAPVAFFPPWAASILIRYGESARSLTSLCVPKTKSGHSGDEARQGSGVKL